MKAWEIQLLKSKTGYNNSQGGEIPLLIYKEMKIFRIKNSRSTRSNTGFKGITKRNDSGKFQAVIVIYRPDNDGNIKRISIFNKVYNTLKEAKKGREDFIETLF